MLFFFVVAAMYRCSCMLQIVLKQQWKPLTKHNHVYVTTMLIYMFMQNRTFVLPRAVYKVDDMIRSFN